MSTEIVYVEKEKKEEITSSPWGIVVFMLPLILLTGFFVYLAYKAALAGSTYKVVQKFVFPLSWAVSNFIGISIMFILSIFFGGFYTISGLLDLTVFVVWGNMIFAFWSFLIGPTSFNFPSIPFWHIIIFQVVVYLTMGRSLNLFFTNTIFALVDRDPNEPETT